MGKNKVLIITPFYTPNIGGAETFAKDLFTELSKSYEDVRVCTIDWKGPKIFKGTGIMQFLDVFPKLFFKTFRDYARQRHSIEDKNLYRVNTKVYCLGINSILIGCILRMIFRIDVYGVLLALYDFNKKSFLFRMVSKFCLCRMERIYVEGHNGMNDVLGLGIDSDRIITFQHWCDQSIFHPVHKTENKFRVLFVGRAIPEKGKYIIQAVERCFNNFKDAEFIYVENVPFKDLPKYYQMADVVVVPSLYPEGFPRVVIEAASCGCAILTSNCGSLPELVRKFGYAIKPTEDSFFYAIRRFYENRNFLATMKLKAHEHALLNFSNKNAEVFI